MSRQVHSNGILLCCAKEEYLLLRFSARKVTIALPWMLQKVYIKVKKNNVVKYVCIYPNAEGVITSNDCLVSILSQFECIPTETFVIKDRDNSVIELAHLFPVIWQYKHSNNFMFVIDDCNNLSSNFQAASLKRCNAIIGADLIINSEVLESYLRKFKCSDIFTEYSHKNSLKDSSRRRLVNAAANLLREHCGNYPTKDEKISAEKAIISLFPSFKTADEKFGGIVRHTEK